MKHVVAFVVAMFAVSVASSAGIAYLFSTVKPSPPPEYELVWTWKRIAPNVVDINANPSANYTAYPAYRAWFNVTGDRFVLAADYITDPNATLLTIELYESVQVLRPRV